MVPQKCLQVLTFWRIALLTEKWRQCFIASVLNTAPSGASPVELLTWKSGLHLIKCLPNKSRFCYVQSEWITVKQLIEWWKSFTSWTQTSEDDWLHVRFLCAPGTWPWSAERSFVWAVLLWASSNKAVLQSCCHKEIKFGDCIGLLKSKMGRMRARWE